MWKGRFVKLSDVSHRPICQFTWKNPWEIFRLPRGLPKRRRWRKAFTATGGNIATGGCWPRKPGMMEKYTFCQPKIDNFLWLVIWKKIRQFQFKKNAGLCHICAGETVDHIVVLPGSSNKTRPKSSGDLSVPKNMSDARHRKGTARLRTVR